MGIDIRDGNQLECINCALCIDACNAVMDKVGKPRGLISYSTASLYAQNTVDKNAAWDWRHLLRPRTFIYSALWAAVGIAMLVSLLSRDRLDVNIVPDRNPLYVQLSDGSIRNGYTVKILQHEAGATHLPHHARRTCRVPPWKWSARTAKGLSSLDVAVEPDKLRAVKIYVATSDKDVLEDQRSDFSFEVIELTQGGVPRIRQL